MLDSIKCSWRWYDVGDDGARVGVDPGWAGEACCRNNRRERVERCLRKGSYPVHHLILLCPLISLPLFFHEIVFFWEDVLVFIGLLSLIGPFLIQMIRFSPLFDSYDDVIVDSRKFRNFFCFCQRRGHCLLSSLYISDSKESRFMFLFDLVWVCSRIVALLIARQTPFSLLLILTCLWTSSLWHHYVMIRLTSLLLSFLLQQYYTNIVDW